MEVWIVFKQEAYESPIPHGCYDSYSKATDECARLASAWGLTRGSELPDFIAALGGEAFNRWARIAQQVPTPRPGGMPEYMTLDTLKIVGMEVG